MIVSRHFYRRLKQWLSGVDLVASLLLCLYSLLRSALVERSVERSTPRKVQCSEQGSRSRRFSHRYAIFCTAGGSGAQSYRLRRDGGLVGQSLTVPFLRQWDVVKGRLSRETISIDRSISARVESVGYLLTAGRLLSMWCILVGRFSYSHCLEREARYWVLDAGMRAGARVCSNAECVCAKPR